MPLLLNLLSVLTFISTFFFRIGAFLSFFFKKILFKPFAISSQIAIVVSIFIFKFAFIVSVFSLFLWIYNKISYILDNLDSSFNGNYISSVAYGLLNSFGIIEAFEVSFKSFSIVFISILILFASKFVIKSLITLSNELFKLHVLIGI